MRVGRVVPRVGLVLGLSGLGVAMLVGCTTVPGGTGVTAGGPVAYVEETSEDGFDGQLTGTVEVSPSCVTVLDDVGQRWLPVFQRHRATWDGAALTYDDRRYGDGSRIDVRGGGVEDTAFIDSLPRDCEYDAVFVVAP